MAGVLTGVRVVELASWTYVPAAGVALADWGADVIKVEGVVAVTLAARWWSEGSPGKRHAPIPTLSLSSAIAESEASH